jgi:hypothetical protein
MAKNFNTFIFLVLLTLYSCYIIYFSLNSGQDGHDNFQYIEFANQILTDEPLILFYRPGLYTLIYAFNQIFGWEPYSLSILYSVFVVITFIYLYLLARIFLKSEILILFTYLLLFFNAQYLIFFQRNYTAIIEITCILGFVYHFYLLSVNEINCRKKYVNINIFITGFFAFLGTHVHEDKSIFFLSFIFVYYFLNKLISVKVFLIFFFLSFVTANYFGVIDVFKNLLKINNVISENFGSKNDVLQNIFFILKDTANFFLGNLFFEFFLFLIIINFFLRKKIKLDFINNYLISLFFYILFLALMYGNINLTRVYAPTGIFLVIIIFNLFEKIYVNLGIFFKILIITVLCFIFLEKFYEFKKYIRPVDNSKFYSAYKYIKLQNINRDKYTIKVLQLPSFENRYDRMWTKNFNTYGLSSKVYFGKNSDNLNNYLIENFQNFNYPLTNAEIFKIYQEFDYIIFDEKKVKDQSFNEKKIIQDIKNTFGNIIIEKNLSIVRIR